MKRHPIAAMIGGAILAAWNPFWIFASGLSTIDFMRTSGGHPSIGTFFLPAGLSAGLSVVGIGVMVYAFILLSQHTSADLDNSQSKPTKAKRDPKTIEGVTVILVAQVRMLLEAYQRLEYEFHDEVMRPLAGSSWPAYGDTWQFVHVRLFTLKAQLTILTGFSEGLWKFMEWPTDERIFKISDNCLMIDLLGALKDFERELTAARGTGTRSGPTA